MASTSWRNLRNGLYLSLFLQLRARASLGLLQKMGPQILSCSIMNHAPIHQQELGKCLTPKVCLQNTAASLGVLVQQMLYSMHHTPNCVEWWIHSACRGKLKSHRSKKALYSLPEINHNDSFFSKQINSLFTCGFIKCDSRGNTAYSHGRYIEFKLKFGIRGFSWLSLSTSLLRANSSEK